MVLTPSLRPQEEETIDIQKCLLPFIHRCVRPKLVEIGSRFLEMKLKKFKCLHPMTDERRTTTDKNSYQ